MRFAGESYLVDPQRPFVMGRAGDLVIDADNPFLHRAFLTITNRNGRWWIANVGSRLAVTVRDGGVIARLSPGASLPLSTGSSLVAFEAGRTGYDLTVHIDVGEDPRGSIETPDGAATRVPDELTAAQRLAVVALAESALRRGELVGSIPTAAQAAARLGWPVTTFNRKLDNVCDKLSRSGVRGLHGGPGQSASGRKARLVEHAIASGLVTTDDLALLDEAADGQAAGQ